MSATTLSASFGGITGSDLEAELAQPRIVDHDAEEAAGFDRADPAHDNNRVGDVPSADALARNGARRCADYSVELRGVGKQYDERKVLSDFDLWIKRGSFVAIVGRSGCGKSTLLRLVAGLEKTTSGVLEKRTEDGRPLDTRIMFQDARLLPWKSVLQNVMLGLDRSAREEARAVHEAVALGERILLIEEGRIALDQPVPLARPRARASAGFAALEEHVLQRVLKTAPNDDALSHRAYDARDEGPLTRAADVRWAV